MIFGGAGPWRALWASASLLRVVPGREKMVEGKKKARRRIQKNVTLFFVTPMCRKHKNAIQNCETLYKMSVSERGCEDFNSRCVFFRNEKMCFSIGFSKVSRMSGVCYY